MTISCSGGSNKGAPAKEEDKSISISTGKAGADELILQAKNAKFSVPGGAFSKDIEVALSKIDEYDGKGIPISKVIQLEFSDEEIINGEMVLEIKIPDSIKNNPEINPDDYIVAMVRAEGVENAIGDFNHENWSATPGSVNGDTYSVRLYASAPQISVILVARKDLSYFIPTPEEVGLLKKLNIIREVYAEGDTSWTERPWAIQCESELTENICRNAQREDGNAINDKLVDALDTITATFPGIEAKVLFGSVLEAGSFIGETTATGDLSKLYNIVAYAEDPCNSVGRLFEGDEGDAGNVRGEDDSDLGCYDSNTGKIALSEELAAKPFSEILAVTAHEWTHAAQEAIMTNISNMYGVDPINKPIKFFLEGMADYIGYSLIGKDLINAPPEGFFDLVKPLHTEGNMFEYKAAEFWTMFSTYKGGDINYIWELSRMMSGLPTQVDNIYKLFDPVNSLFGMPLSDLYLHAVRDYRSKNYNYPFCGDYHIVRIGKEFTTPAKVLYPMSATCMGIQPQSNAFQRVLIEPNVLDPDVPYALIVNGQAYKFMSLEEHPFLLDLDQPFMELWIVNLDMFAKPTEVESFEVKIKFIPTDPEEEWEDLERICHPITISGCFGVTDLKILGFGEWQQRVAECGALCPYGRTYAQYVTMVQERKRRSDGTSFHKRVTMLRDIGDLERIKCSEKEGPTPAPFNCFMGMKDISRQEVLEACPGIGADLTNIRAVPACPENGEMPVLSRYEPDEISEECSTVLYNCEDS